MENTRIIYKEITCSELFKYLADGVDCNKFYKQELLKPESSYLKMIPIKFVQIIQITPDSKIFMLEEE